MLKVVWNLFASDAADYTQIYDKNIRNSSQNEEVADLLSLMEQELLFEQTELSIDLDIAFVTSNNLCEWMDILSNINVIKLVV